MAVWHPDAGPATNGKTGNFTLGKLEPTEGIEPTTGGDHVATETGPFDPAPLPLAQTADQLANLAPPLAV